MDVFEKAKNTLLEDLIPTDEQYHGIAFLYYSEIITRDEYTALMELFKMNHPNYT